MNNCGGCRNLGNHNGNCRFKNVVTVGRCSNTHLKNDRKTFKHSYATRQDALDAMEFILWQKKQGGGVGTEKDAYQCRVCNNWHLTSRRQ